MVYEFQGFINRYNRIDTPSGSFNFCGKKRSLILAHLKDFFAIHCTKHYTEFELLHGAGIFFKHIKPIFFMSTIDKIIPVSIVLYEFDFSLDFESWFCQ